MPNLKTKLKSVKNKKAKKEGPVWKGPEVDGVTQSLLSRFLVCKERFRLLVIEGWQPNEGFSAPLEYGNMWHTCEEEFARTKGQDDNWQRALFEYCKGLCGQYPTEQQQVLKWYNVCLNQFPIYAKYWSKHPDVKNRTPLLQEQVFKIPYKLPSGRVVLLRGKWDSVDLIGKGKSAGTYLQENKTKSRIDEGYLTRQLTFDLQTMTYLVALVEESDCCKNSDPLGLIDYDENDPVKKLFNRGSESIKGIRYNIIRRTERRQKKGSKNIAPETAEEFGVRCGLDFVEDPAHWFMRWIIEITPSDIQRFKDEFLDPCLEHLCLWYKQQTTGLRGLDLTRGDYFLHYRLPYGVYNNVMEGRGGDIEEYLLSGSTTGLRRVDNLFPELEW